MEEEAQLVREFLIESNENLSRLDQEMVDLEKHPEDAELLASIFRTVHTIKGTCGFLNFGHLENITHHAENILGQLRDGERKLTRELTSILLETIDAIKVELTHIEETGSESGEEYADLLRRQKAIYSAKDPVEPVIVQPAAAVPVKAEDTPPARRRSDTSGSVTDSTIRVDVALLNRLMNLVGELVLARNQILQFTANAESASLIATAQKLNLITTELQEAVMRTRMQPIGNVWAGLPRVVRDLANACSKQISVEMDGAETELDKTIIEAIKDPLTHIVRNSCDHGIESPEQRVLAGKPAQGKLKLSAFHEGGNVNIEIVDDGGGIDPQRIRASALNKGLITPDRAERMTDRELVNLIFLPGFSTAAQVSSISGRGVGMDVVKTNIEKIGGTVDLASRHGHGTTVRIRIPLTLAIVPGLVVTSGGERFIIPQISLLELIRVEGDRTGRQIEEINGTPVYRRRGHLLPLACLNQVLKVSEARRLTEGAINIVVLQAEDEQFGLIVDEIIDTQEIVVKPLGNILRNIRGFAGATVMGDGKIALILDVAGIAAVSGVMHEAGEAVRTQELSIAADSGAGKQALLLFCAGSFERLAVPLSLVARLEEFEHSRIERAAGGLVLQYRGQILSLVHLAALLGSGSPAEIPDPFTVVVFADGDRRVGVIVDRIIDIVEDTLQIRKAGGHRCLLGSAVVAGRITDFLDIHAVTEEFGGAEAGVATEGGPSTVLLTESSPYSRGLVRNYLEIAGHNVIEASTCAEALARLDEDQVHAVMTALDLPEPGALALLSSMRQRKQTSRIPVIALNPRREPDERRGGDQFSDCLFKHDRDGMLRSLDRLIRAVANPIDIEKEISEGVPAC